MSTTISILVGVGLLLLGMTVMTEGLKALAGSSKRRVLGRRRQLRCPARSGAPWSCSLCILERDDHDEERVFFGEPELRALSRSPGEPNG